MPDFIGISFKQAPWLKFDFLKIVVGRGQEDIGAAMFSSSQKLSTAHTGIKMFAGLIQSTVLLLIEQFLIGNGCIHDEKGLVIGFQLEIFFSNVKRFHVVLRQEISVRNHMCQCSACFMGDRCMFIGFVVAYGGLIRFFNQKHVEIQCFGLLLLPPLLQISEPNLVCT